MDRYFNRELSALEFNARVLAEGRDVTLPLFERLKFTGIVSSNLDEFFMVRVASLLGSKAQFDLVREKAKGLMEETHRYFMDTLVPELESVGIIRLRPETCSPSQLEYLRNYFSKELLPVLTPIALASDKPLPVLTNLGLHMLVSLKSGARAEDVKVAVVEIPPKGFPRLVFLPTEKDYPFVLLEDVVSFFAAELFPGFEIVDKGLMRITRGTDLTLDEEKDEDFMHVMAEALRERQEGAIVRMELSDAKTWTPHVSRLLRVAESDIFWNQAWFDLKTISQLAFQTGFDALKRAAWKPGVSPAFEEADDVWTLLKERSVLIFHPYESFDAVIRFLEEAAEDPDVLAIKQTLYRTEQDSAVLRALERAAENGKRVTVLVELKARFDEENNMGWARRLIQRGASVLYGIAGYKTHAKACLVIRREREGIRRYVHLGTGNYNSKTARIYSDIGYFTSDEAYAGDISAFFNMITGYSQPASWNKIDVAPFTLRRKLLRLIRREAMRSTSEKPGLIRMKMNSLVDPEMIEALYQASAQGTRIQLNVRGICCLRPGVPGLSDHIQVISIVDQFLEHSRLFYFENGGEAEIYMSSADLMPRNLDKRIEIMFPVDDAECRKRLIDTLDLYFHDTVKSWILLPDGSYARTEAGNRRRVRAQEALCERAQEEERARVKSIPKELKPQRPNVKTGPRN